MVLSLFLGVLLSAVYFGGVFVTLKEDHEKYEVDLLWPLTWFKSKFVSKTPGSD